MSAKHNGLTVDDLLAFLNGKGGGEKIIIWGTTSDNGTGTIEVGNHGITNYD